jgi:hypothetical protein
MHVLHTSITLVIILVVILIIILIVASMLYLSQPSRLLLAPWVFVSSIALITEFSIILCVFVRIAAVFIVRINLFIRVIGSVMVLGYKRSVVSP